MGDLTDYELESIERSLGGPARCSASHSETCRMVTELRRHRAAQTASAERMRVVVLAEATAVLSELVSLATFVQWPHARTALEKTLAAHRAPEPASGLLPEVIMSDDRPSIAELSRLAVELRAEVERGMDPAVASLARSCGKDDVWIADQSRQTDAVATALRVLLEIVAAALAFHERWQTADFEDDTKPARQALFAALVKVRP